MITQGKWHKVELDACYSIQNDNRSRICTIPKHMEHEGNPCGSIISQDKTDEELQANAALIAAAPELLEACKFLVSKFDDIDFQEIPAPIFNVIENSIKQAIAKATNL